MKQLRSLEQPITGEIEELTQEDIGTLALIKKMRSGDVRAYESVMDSGDSEEAVQTNDINVNKDGLEVFME